MFNVNAECELFRGYLNEEFYKKVPLHEDAELRPACKQKCQYVIAHRVLHQYTTRLTFLKLPRAVQA